MSDARRLALACAAAVPVMLACGGEVTSGRLGGAGGGPSPTSAAPPDPTAPTRAPPTGTADASAPPSVPPAVDASIPWSSNPCDPLPPVAATTPLFVLPSSALPSRIQAVDAGMAYYTTQYYGRGGSCTTPGLWVRTSNELTDLGLTCQNGVGTAWGEWLWLPPAGFSATGQAVHLPDAEFVELTLGQSALLSALAGPHGLVVATRDATTLETHLVRFTSPHDPPMELTTFGDGPAYVAQGERMIFLMQVNQDLDAGEVWAVDPNTGAKRALGATPGCCPWVAAGGDFVYLVHASATPGRYTFTVFDGRTGASRQFETDAGRALAATREFLYYGDGERLYRRRHCGDEEQLVAESVLTFATDERAVYVVKGAEVFEIRH